MPSHFLKNLPFLVLPPLFWAGNFVVGKVIRDDIPPFSLSFGRWVLAFLFILPFAWRWVQRDWTSYRTHFGKIVATSIVGVASFNTLIYKGLHDTTTTNALLLNSCIPVLIMLMGAVFYQQKLKYNQIMGLIVSMLGVTSIILAGDIQRLLTLSFNSGDLWVFLAMICWAFYTLWMKQIPPEINKIGLMAVQIVLALITLLPLFLWEILFHNQTIHLHQQSILGLAYIGVFPSVVAYLLYAFAVTKVGAIRAGLSIHLMPVFGVLLSVSILDEIFQAYHAAGIGLIALGLILSNRTQ
ncbi:MAG: DMT family transporter [Alysiella sp.]|uniref:DMT family transporter n=1 Tax=Alysiella sp. TaxID=1872483 RepID=UPI0026DA7167|nr:DMT family transporter [Alysiella sp.]MDO4433679.1 DMT family transporter [Alysiella sp.]